jgi:hypothetical protein
MMKEKQQLSAAQIEAQVAAELPEREMMALVNVVALNGVNVAVPVGIAANVCGVNAAVLAQDLAQDGSATCEAQNAFDIGQGAQNRFGIIQ